MAHLAKHAAYPFIVDESAAVTVDWVVLSAAVIVMALAALWPVFLGEGNILSVVVERVAWAVGFDWATSLE